MKRKILRRSLVLLPLAVLAWDNFGGIEIDKSWSQPDGVKYPFGERITVSVHGRQSPIRIFDLDNEFTLRVTDGGYVYMRQIDLIGGQDHYQSYLDSCLVQWTEDAVSFIETDGAEIRLPIAMLKRNL